MKNITYMIFLATLLMACGNKGKKDVETDQSNTTPMMVLQIQKTSRLYTTEYRLHKIITHKDVKSITGKVFNQSFHIDLPLGKRKIAIPIDATLKAYIDFNNFTSKNIKRVGKKIEIILPDPRIVLTSTKINHQEVKQYVAITRSNFTDEELTSFEHQGRAAIIKDISSLDLISTAKENAAKTLIPFIKQMGYTEADITITFRKEFNLNDIGKLIDNTTTENGK